MPKLWQDIVHPLLCERYGFMDRWLKYANDIGIDRDRFNLLMLDRAKLTLYEAWLIASSFEGCTLDSLFGPNAGDPVPVATPSLSQESDVGTLAGLLINRIRLEVGEIEVLRRLLLFESDGVFSCSTGSSPLPRSEPCSCRPERSKSRVDSTEP